MTISAILSHKQNKPVLIKFYAWAALLVLLPAFTFTLLKYFILPLTTMDPSTKTIWSGAAAIICVKLLTIVYTYSAFTEDDSKSD